MFHTSRIAVGLQLWTNNSLHLKMSKTETKVFQRSHNCFIVTFLHGCFYHNRIFVYHGKERQREATCFFHVTSEERLNNKSYFFVLGCSWEHFIIIVDTQKPLRQIAAVVLQFIWVSSFCWEISTNRNK